MTNEPIVKCITFEKAEEFLDALSTRSDYFKPEPRQWIFRGVSNESWHLVPSALRDDAVLKTPEGWRSLSTGECQDEYEQRRYELATLEAFFWLADSTGLSLPEDSQQMRRHFSRFLIHLKEEYRWLPRELLSLAALAQHHGVPTRLLDWTHRANVAAYFAAYEAARWIKDSCAPQDVRRLAVWAMKYKPTGWIIPIDPSFKHEFPVISVHAPRAGNPNLHAQSGLFTLYQSLARPGDPKYSKRLDEAFEKEHLLKDWPRPVFYKLTLPIEESPTLLRCLAQEGISGATLFPGFDGVAKRIKEEQYWGSYDGWDLSWGI